MFVRGVSRIVSDSFVRLWVFLRVLNFTLRLQDKCDLLVVIFPTNHFSPSYIPVVIVLFTIGCIFLIWLLTIAVTLMSFSERPPLRLASCDQFKTQAREPAKVAWEAFT